MRDSDGFPFWEPFLRNHGVEKYECLDVSKHEQAGILHDLNQPLPPNQAGRWDLVVDAGTCEHVYNFPQAVRNAVDLARPGGWLFFVSPCEGFAGHGFYQISPEFFHRTFSRERGFDMKKVWLNCPAGSPRIYEVLDSSEIGDRNPSPGQPSFLFSLVRKLASASDFPPPVQADYQAILQAAALPGDTTNPKILQARRIKSVLRGILGKRRYGRMVALKSWLLARLDRKMSPRHYRRVCCWPPRDSTGASGGCRKKKK